MSYEDSEGYDITYRKDMPRRKRPWKIFRKPISPLVLTSSETKARDRRLDLTLVRLATFSQGKVACLLARTCELTGGDVDKLKDGYAIFGFGR